jgi:hypothetical protein
MDIKRKTCHIRTCEKHLFLDISSTNIRTLVPSLYECVETRSIEVISEMSATFLDSVVNRFTRQTLPTVNRKHFFTNILCTESSCPQKKTHNRILLFGIIFSSTVAIRLLKPASEHEHARLLPRLSLSWTVLLPSDTHRKPIMLITAVLLPLVTYLLTLPRIYKR